MKTHKQLVKQMLTKPAVKAAYDSQAEEFALLDVAAGGAPTGRPDAGASRRKNGHQDPGGRTPGSGRRIQAALAVDRHAAQIRRRSGMPLGGSLASSINHVARPAPSLAEGRAVVRRSFEVRIYEPREN